MRLRSFLILLCVTGIAVAVAAALVVGQPRPVSVAGVGEPVLPGLLDKANRISRIQLTSGDATLTLAQGENDWVIESDGGYPASFEKIKSLVVGLAQLRRVEPKTDRPDRYGKIGVADAGPGASSTEISLLDHDGTPVARLLVGEDSLSAGNGGRYVRVPGEAQAWLAAGGSVDPSLAAHDWAEPEIIDVPASEVRAVRIKRPNGETILASKQDPSEPHLVLGTVPRGSRPKSPDIADGLAGALTSIQLDDVKPAAEVDFPPADTTRVRIETFDGLVIDMDLVERDETNWVRLMPSAAEGAPPETVAKVQSLAERLRDWAYQVSSWRLTQLKRGLSDLVDTEHHE